MASRDWQAETVAERIAVDREFHERVQQSSFSNQQWELIMTATEFEIEHPTDPERARIVADVSNHRHVAPELDRIESGMYAMGGESGQRSSSGGGLLDSIRSFLGIGGRGADREMLDEAAALADEYARELQRQLESSGQWDRIRERAAR